MNAGQEIFDYIKVTDSRNGDARTGNIGSLRKVWKAATERRSSQYYMQFSFGAGSTPMPSGKTLRPFGGGIASNSGLERLSVKDLYAEKIQADSLDMVWIDPEGNVDLSQIGDTLDNLPDGENYARVKSTHIEAGDKSNSLNMPCIRTAMTRAKNAGYSPHSRQFLMTWATSGLKMGLVKRCTCQELRRNPTVPGTGRQSTRMIFQTAAPSGG